MTTYPAVLENQPLPPNPFLSEPDLHAAYDQCLVIQNNTESEDIELIYARCLGYFLIELPVDRGRRMVAEDIVLCSGEKEKMNRLAELYINHIIRLFRQSKGSTPTPSQHPSRPYSDHNASFFSATVEPAPRDHRTAKRAALERDNYECMVTGLIDRGKYHALALAERAARGIPIQTNFCHIFPPSVNWDLDLNVPDFPKTTHAGNMWNLVSAFGGIQVLDDLNAGSIHRLSNGLTLAVHVHQEFDNLDVWFEEVQSGPPNTYFLRSMAPVLAARITPLTFTSSSLDLELPDPRYLKLHAAICRVAHMSGAAEYLEKHDRDVELMPVLSQDGSSNHLLASLLQRVVLEQKSIQSGGIYTGTDI